MMNSQKKYSSAEAGRISEAAKQMASEKQKEAEVEELEEEEEE
jgi:hypothetical protein